MSNTMTASSDQYWMQYYQQPLMDHTINHHQPIEIFSDSTIMTTNPTPLETMVISPTNSYTNTSDQLTPKGGNVSKPIRRRSRASKRTPTTLLNANTTNFRQLVQQFTGCPSTNLAAAGSLGVHKGPITLNFQQGSKQNIQHESTARLMPQFSSTSYNQVHHQVTKPFPWKKEQIIQVPQQHQSGNNYNNSFEYVKNNTFVPNSGNSSSRPSNMDVSDGLVVDNDFGLHDLTVNEFSNDTFM